MPSSSCAPESAANGSDLRPLRFRESQLQKQIDEIGAICSKSGLLLKEVSYRPLVLQTVVGVVRLKAAYGYSTSQGIWITPAREAWGMSPHQRGQRQLIFPTGEN